MIVLSYLVITLFLPYQDDQTWRSLTIFREMGTTDCTTYLIIYNMSCIRITCPILVFVNINLSPFQSKTCAATASRREIKEHTFDAAYDNTGFEIQAIVFESTGINHVRFF